MRSRHLTYDVRRALAAAITALVKEQADGTTPGSVKSTAAAMVRTTVEAVALTDELDPLIDAWLETCHTEERRALAQAQRDCERREAVVAAWEAADERTRHLHTLHGMFAEAMRDHDAQVRQQAVRALGMAVNTLCGLSSFGAPSTEQIEIAAANSASDSTPKPRKVLQA